MPLSLLSEDLPINVMGASAVECIRKYEEAIGQLESENIFDRVRLLSAQAVALSNIHSPESQALAAQAALFAQNADEKTRAYASVADCLSHVTPDTLERRILKAREILSIAIREQDLQLGKAGFYILLVALLEKGQITDLDLELTGRGYFSSRIPGLDSSEPAQWFRCLRAILDGDTVTALGYVKEYLSTHDPAQDQSQSFPNYIAQLGIIRWMQGEIHDAEHDFLLSRRMFPEQIIWPASLCWLWLRQGRVTAAQTLFESLPARELIPYDRYWLPTMVTLAEVSILLGDPDFASEMREILLPYAEHLVAIGVGVAFWGTVSRTLGLLEEHLGLVQSAREHLEFAIEITRRIGAQAWMVEAQIELAEFALRNGVVEIDALGLLCEAEITARSRGFLGLLTRAQRKPKINILGRFEVIPHNSEPIAWSSRKSRDLLKLLIASRGITKSREEYMDILWPDVPSRELINRFTVAVTVIRRALDPEKHFPTQYYVQVQDESIRLNIERLDIDVEQFLKLAQSTDETILKGALALYQGEAFSDEPYSEWATELRDTVEQARALVEFTLGRNTQGY